MYGEFTCPLMPCALPQGISTVRDIVPVQTQGQTLCSRLTCEGSSASMLYTSSCGGYDSKIILAPMAEEHVRASARHIHTSNSSSMPKALAVLSKQSVGSTEDKVSDIWACDCFDIFGCLRRAPVSCF